MAGRKTTKEPERAVLSSGQMSAAIPTLKRRIEELRALDVNSIQERGDPKFEAIENKIDDTLVEIFGHDTVEYRRYTIGSLDTASVNWAYATPIAEVREGY